MDKQASVLSTKTRINMPKSEFALPKHKKPGKPGEGAYPIPDRAHARSALSFVSRFGTSAEKAKVRAKVHSEYPTMGKKAEVEETEMDKIAAALALGTALADQDLLGLRKEAMDTAARLMLMAGVGPAPDDGFDDNDINELGKIAQALDVGAAVDEFQRQRAMRTLRHGGVGALGGAAGGAGLGALIQALRGENVGEGMAAGAGLGGMAGLYGGMIHGGLSKTPRAKKVEKKEHEKEASLDQALELQKTAMVGTLQRLMNMEKVGLDIPGIGNVDIGSQIESLKQLIQENPEAAGAIMGGVGGAGVGALAGGEGHRGKGALVGGLLGGGLGAGAGYGAREIMQARGAAENARAGSLDESLRKLREFEDAQQAGTGNESANEIAALKNQLASTPRTTPVEPPAPGLFEQAMQGADQGDAAAEQARRTQAAMERIRALSEARSMPSSPPSQGSMFTGLEGLSR